MNRSIVRFRRHFVQLGLLALTLSAPFAQAADETSPYLRCQSRSPSVIVTVTKLRENKKPAPSDDHFSDMVARRPTYQFDLKVQKLSDQGMPFTYYRKGQGYTSDDRTGKITLFDANAGESGSWDKAEARGSLFIERCTMHYCEDQDALRAVFISDGLAAVEMFCAKQE